MGKEIVIRSPFSAKPDAVANAAWNRNIHTQAKKVAAAAWSKGKEVFHLTAIREKVPVEVLEAVKVVSEHPLRVGQPAKEVYIANFPASRGGDVINLTAVWDGAARLAENPSVRLVSLELNPNIVGKENATVLTVHRAEGRDIEQSRVIYREGATIVQGDALDLAPTIFANIVKELR